MIQCNHCQRMCLKNLDYDNPANNVCDDCQEVCSSKCISCLEDYVETWNYENKCNNCMFTELNYPDMDTFGQQIDLSWPSKDV